MATNNSSVTEDVDAATNHSHEMTMDDSTMTTVEFLRARLLAERSISKITRQRADELAKRVAQLEEQLNIVTLQRKQAEKATSEVLAILESHGISDLSEVCDSCSDQEGINDVSKKIDDIGTDEVNLTRPEEIKDQELKDLGLGVSSSVSRSLSWKACSDNPIFSCEDAKGVAKPKRHSSFVSTSGLSMKHQLRKSRRQIRQRQTRSCEAKLNEESILLDAQENVAAARGDASQCITSIPSILEQGHKKEKEYAGNSVQSLLEDQRRKGQYEAQENSQREWEEKFKGNTCNSLDCCEHGNHSDITEEKDDTRTETSEAVETTPFIEQGGNARREQVRGNTEVVKEDRNTQSVPHPHHDIRYSKDQQKCIKSTGDASQNTCTEFSFPSQLNVEAKSNGKQKAERPKNTPWRSVSHGSSQHQAADPHGSFNKVDSSRNESQVSSHQGYPNSLGSVLDALQRAKLSLNSLASSTHGRAAVGRTKSYTPSITSRNAMNMAVGCAELFKVPTSPEFEAPVKQSSLTHSTSDSNPSRYYPDPRRPSSPYLESGAKNSIRNPFLDPQLDKRVGLPSSSSYMYPSYVDSIPKTAPNNGFPRTYPSMGLEKSNEDLYTEYNNQTRFDLYRG